MEWEGRSHRGYYFWVRDLGFNKWVYAIGNRSAGYPDTVPPPGEVVGAEEFETKGAAEQAARKEIDRDIALQRANSPDPTRPRKRCRILGDGGELPD